MTRPSVRRPLGALSMLLSAALLAACGSLNSTGPQAPLPPTLDAPAAPAKAATGTVAVKVLAINDFHGNLLPPAGGIKLPDPQDPAKTVTLASEATSQYRVLAPSCSPRTPSASLSISASSSRAPRAANASAHCRPIPRQAPMISTRGCSLDDIQSPVAPA